MIVGAGGYGRSVAEAVLLAGHYRVMGFIDDCWPKVREVWGHPVVGTTDVFSGVWQQYTRSIVVAIGNNAVRERLHAGIVAAGLELATVIHPRAIVSERAKLGPGCTVMAGAVIGTEAELGEGVIVNSAAVVDHHCRVSDFGHLGVGACMAGGTVVGRGAWLQAGSVLGYGAELPAGRVLNPGAALLETKEG